MVIFHSYVSLPEGNYPNSWMVYNEHLRFKWMPMGAPNKILGHKKKYQETRTEMPEIELL